MIACHECDLLHEFQPLSGGEKACCSRCSATLYQHIPNSIERSLALYLAALVCFFIANTFPFLSLQFGGRIEENILLSGALALYQLGMGELGLLVFFTSILFPFIVITGMIYMLLPLKFGHRSPGTAQVFRLVQSIQPWSMLGVFMLGILLAVVKLQAMATVIPGISLFSFVALLILYSAAVASFDPHSLWPHVNTDTDSVSAGKTASQCGLLNCHTCNLLLPAPAGGHQHYVCPRCETPLHLRKMDSSGRTWALVLTAALLLIPANLYPIMTVISFGQGEPDTIISGITHLIEAGMWPLGIIVLFASIIVPSAKLGILSLLLFTTGNTSGWRPVDRTLLYRITEIVGAWSMVDIYLIAILAALVNLDALATIEPGPGALFFAAAVVITMFAAHSFDPRLIWDNLPPPETARELPDAA